MDQENYIQLNSYKDGEQYLFNLTRVELEIKNDPFGYKYSLIDINTGARYLKGSKEYVMFQAIHQNLNINNLEEFKDLHNALLKIYPDLKN